MSRISRYREFRERRAESRRANAESKHIHKLLKDDDFELV
jgi:hypothetical protein